jgi:hypothetical protein
VILNIQPFKIKDNKNYLLKITKIVLMNNRRCNPSLMMLNNTLHQIDLIKQKLINMMIVEINQLILGIKDLIHQIEIENKWRIMIWRINNLKIYHKDKG